MQTIGIIAEYNPFHSGHLYQIQQIRARYGAEASVVCAMSGNWVQRGDAALCDKWTRAGMALRGGVDLVLELPTAWAMASAERFANGSVAILSASGVVDTLCFGSEVGDLTPLLQTADFLLSADYPPALRRALEAGCSFPRARQAAASESLGTPADCLQTPNNNLGVEYLCALRRQGSPLQACTLKRQGVAHDSPTLAENFASASHLRRLLLTDTTASLRPYLQKEDVLALQESGLHTLSYATQAVLARLRLLSPEELLPYPDCGEGLHRKLHEAALRTRSLDELYEQVKSRRYTHARIRRLVLAAFLDLRADERPDFPPYLRVLGMNQRGQALLRRMKQEACLPVLTKAAHITRLPENAQKLFRLEARCTSLYDLCRTSVVQAPFKTEYTENPVLL